MAVTATADELTLEHTPTWIVAIVCSIFVAFSLALERILHYTGKYLKKRNQKALYEALLKVKEELMLLGFISLLLTVFQDWIAKICMPVTWADYMLPCSKETTTQTTTLSSSFGITKSHYQISYSSFVFGSGRRLLASSSTDSNYCQNKGKAPLLSTEALHHLHIFIFVLAIVHVTFCVLTILFGVVKMRKWKRWEDSNKDDKYDPEKDSIPAFTDVHQHAFIRERFKGVGKRSSLLGWLHAFVKQFLGSVTKLDYLTLRMGFVNTHCKGNLKFDFHKYMIRCLEADFKKVVGISWYLWIFVVIFLLLDVNGWHTYFWLAFVPFILLLAVGTKLEHVITQLAHEVAEKHAAIEGDLVVQPKDSHFWFNRPRVVLFLIHITLFQNSFEMAFFFWIWVQYGFDSCIMGHFNYIIPRLVIGVVVQVLCSYSTLPLYAIITQMGSSFNKVIFEDHIQVGLVGWAQKAKMKNKGGLRSAVNGSSVESSKDGSTVGIQLGKVTEIESAVEEGSSTSGGPNLRAPSTSNSEPGNS